MKEKMKRSQLQNRLHKFDEGENETKLVAKSSS
ncbi:hypothetical protein J2S19_000553 [Metabacillus malikii]|uniref:Uncharacterized protein n=1 Tax=Metabacillus malikii TaxID=1504265 RepID=A0ABT9ZAN6_9BACI|nr:hypothetical protein [Metabacillus malikii]